MRIGTISFHASFNYGSMLQAWALQTYLEKEGHQVEIINYRSWYQKAHYAKPFDVSSPFSMMASLKRLFLAPSSFPHLYSKWNLFNDFLNQHLHITKEYHTYHQLKKANFNYDLVITGSDQIWINTLEAGKPYYANFISPNIKKISYAPSMGPQTENIPSIRFLKKNLKNFTALSVRERQTKDYIENNGLFYPVEIVCDPTLLLNAQDYETLIDQKPLINEPYIFLYTPGKAKPSYFEIAEQIAINKNMQVITETSFYPRDINKYPHIKLYPETGPKEFLNLIKNATYVVGGSFHLLVFSLQFKKKFFCINGDKDLRTNNLLKVVGLENRAVSLNNPHVIPDNPINNYEDCLEKLKLFRKSSMDFLNINLIKVS